MNNKLLEQVKNIENDPIDKVIEFAKNYDIFQSNGTKFYYMVVDKIKERLQKEGLSIDTVRPDNK